MGQSLPIVRATVTTAGSTFVVNSTADLPDGNVTDNLCLALNEKCTLRAAIMQANFSAGMDTILLTAGTYTLTIPGVDDNDQVGDLDIGDDLVIEGAGPDQTIVDGNGAVTGDRVFHILSTANQTTLSDMTIRDGDTVYTNASQDAGFGGGIYQDGGDLSLIDMVIEDNQASYGGGLVPSFLSRPGTTSLERVTIRSNQAQYDGGAIGSTGGLVIYSTTLEANTAITNGGGLYNGGLVHILQSTLSGNSAQYGGGIYHFEGSGNPNMLLDNTTLSGNTASRDGGGLYADGRFITLHNVTIADNHVLVPVDILYDGTGGGLYASQNVQSGSVGLQFKNTLLSDNTTRYQTNPPIPNDCYAILATLYSLGHNLIEANACLIGGTTTGNILSQDPLLGPLQNNGGSTRTQVPMMGSPAIDRGDNTACPSIDQRGWHRPIGLSCDIGAVEVGLPIYLLLIQR